MTGSGIMTGEHPQEHAFAALQNWLQAYHLEEESRRNWHLLETPDGKTLLFEAGSGLFLGISDLGKAILNLRMLPASQAREEIGHIARRFPASEIAACMEELEAILRLLDRQALPSPARERETAPSGISLQTMFGCNLACRYCFAAPARKHSPVRTMAPSTARRALDWLADSLQKTGEQGVIHVNSAAEPMLGWELLLLVDDYRRDLERARGVSLVLCILTNGTLLTEERARILHDRGIYISSVSLDGPPEIHDGLRRFPDGQGSYQAVARNLPHIQEFAPPWLAAAATLTGSYPQPRRIVEHLLALGFPQIILKPVRAPHSAPYAVNGQTLEAVKEGYRDYVCWFLDRLEAGDERILDVCVNPGDFFGRFVLRLLGRHRLGYRCTAGSESLAVAPDGGLYPCDNFIGIEAFRLGDVFQGLDRQQALLGGEALYVDAKPGCRACWARYLCGGGCYASAHLATGDPTQPDPVQCELVRVLIEYGMWFLDALSRRAPEMLARLAQRGQQA